MAYKEITRDQFNPKADQVNFVILITDFSKASPIDQTLNITTYSDGAKLALPLAKIRMSNFRTNVLTAEGAAVTADIGVTGALTQWHNDLDLNATGLTSSSGAEIELDNTAGDKFITIKPTTNLDAAKLQLSFDIRVVDRNS